MGDNTNALIIGLATGPELSLLKIAVAVDIVELPSDSLFACFCCPRTLSKLGHDQSVNLIAIMNKCLLLALSKIGF